MDFLYFKDKNVSSLLEIEKDDSKEQLKEKDLFYETNENPVSKILVAKDGDNIVGYLDYWITFDSSTIFKIIVKKEYRGKGIASKLLEIMFEDLRKNEVLYATLEVRKSNENAIKLYKKHDFKEITTKEKYYNDGEDAIYMVRGI